MRYLIILVINFFIAFNSYTCDFFSLNEQEAMQYMGKKSKIYDAYKHGKCVLENALEPLSEDQRKIIANLIAKSYTVSK